MKQSDFEFLSKLLKERSGLALTSDKTYLLESRLTPLAKERGMADISAMVASLRSKPDEELIRSITDAMTTNESMFFRDNKPFEQFKTVVLPQIMQNNAASKKIRIWSAACSNGQEPYSLAMIIKEQGAKLAGWNIEIIATDICRKVLDKAKEGVYSQFEVQRGLPITMLVKYFEQKASQWQLKPEIRQMVKFQEKNLLDSFAAMGKFDVILCRNVLIYFDENTKREVLTNLHNVLNNNGFLFLGSTETVFGVNDKYKSVPDCRGLYQPV